MKKVIVVLLILLCISTRSFAQDRLSQLKSYHYDLLERWFTAKNNLDIIEKEINAVVSRILERQLTEQEKAGEKSATKEEPTKKIKEEPNKETEVPIEEGSETKQ